MDLTQLLYFKEAAEREHFSQAAQRLHLTQPALSKSILNLEQEFNVKFFDRSKSKVRLNENGRILLRHVRQIFSELSAAKAEISEQQYRNSSSIYISNILTLPSSHLIKDYLIAHPDVHIHQLQFPTEQLVKKLENCEIDFAICSAQVSDKLIHWRSLFNDRIYAVIYKGHPFAERDSLSLSELSNERFLVNNNFPELTESFFNSCIQANFTPNVIYEGNRGEVIYELARDGYGIFLIPEAMKRYSQSHIPNWGQGFSFVKLKDPHCVYTIGIASLKRRSLSPQAQEFYDYLVDNLSSMGKKKSF